MSSKNELILKSFEIFKRKFRDYLNRHRQNEWCEDILHHSLLSLFEKPDYYFTGKTENDLVFVIYSIVKRNFESETSDFANKFINKNKRIRMSLPSSEEVEVIEDEVEGEGEGVEYSRIVDWCVAAINEESRDIFEREFLLYLFFEYFVKNRKIKDIREECSVTGNYLPVSFFYKKISKLKYIFIKNKQKIIN